MKRSTIFAALLAAAPAFAQAPDAAPAPDPRPDPEDRIGVDVGVGVEEAVADGAAPATVPEPPVWKTLEETEEAFAACTAALAELGAVFEPISPISEPKDADCGIARPLLVAEIAPGVALRPESRMRCETALATARWMTRIVAPAAALWGKRGEVVGLEHGSTYVCRRRNNLASGKLSHHAFGNAIDIMAFRFSDGPDLRVEPREREGSYAEAFQRAVRAGACLTFTTVLGPGSDAAHADHLHLDIAKRRGGWRLCQ